MPCYGIKKDTILLLTNDISVFFGIRMLVCIYKKEFSFLCIW